MTVLTEVDHHAIEYICLNMREADRLEIYGTRRDDSPIQLAWEAYHMLRNQGRARVAWYKGRPAGVVGLTETWPRAWDVSMFGTDDMNRVAVPMLRWLKHELVDLLDVTNCGAHRLHCHARIGDIHESSHKMIIALGGVPEGPPKKGYGKDGSSYQCYCWWPDVNAHFKYPGYIARKDAENVLRLQKQNDSSASANTANDVRLHESAA